jgi:hypothetical protein
MGWIFCPSCGRQYKEGEGCKNPACPARRMGPPNAPVQQRGAPPLPSKVTRPQPPKLVGPPALPSKVTRPQPPKPVGPPSLPSKAGRPQPPAQIGPPTLPGKVNQPTPPKSVGPPQLPKKTGQLQARPLAAGQTVYRGDSRKLEQLNSKGFEPWVHLEPDEAKLFLLVASGFMKWEDCKDLYDKYIASGRIKLNDTLLGNRRNPMDLLEWRIRTGSGNRRVCMVSTDIRPSCGGYANGYIYKMHLEGVQEVSWSKAIPNVTGEKALWPRLLLNRSTLAEATIIAIKAPPAMALREVSFLTNIPKDKIVDAQYVG